MGGQLRQAASKPWGNSPKISRVGGWEQKSGGWVHLQHLEDPLGEISLPGGNFKGAG